MSDYNNVWSQLFRLNPEQPQTPMLSAQELQEELALWSNAQFQTEPAGDDAGPGSATRKSSAGGHWGFLDGVAGGKAQPAAPLQQQHQQQQPAQLSFLMESGASTADLLSAITSPGAAQSPASWAQLAQPAQGPGPVVVNGVPMVPLAPVSIAPAPTGGAAPRHTPIVPRAVTAAKSSDSVVARRGAAKAAKSAATPGSSTQSPEPGAAAAAAATPADEAGEQGRRRAAEEDKRRRNTAASARFRVKKKLKEQALERTAQEMTAKAEALERRVRELETETRWLKSLITEKDPAALAAVACPCHHPDGLLDAPAKRARLQ